MMFKSFSMDFRSFETLIDNHEPPTLYSLAESYVNYDRADPVAIMELAKEFRKIVFIDYPLSNKVDKEKFETNIINHFLMRRIGQETFTAFKLQLNNKLNEIMPKYNILFDALDGWSLFKDGEVTDRTLDTENESEAKNKANTTSTNTSDRRYANMPDNELQNIRDGSYITDYNYDQSATNSNDNSESTGSSKSTNVEHITRTPSDKNATFNDFMREQNSIYTRIYQELEPCFYGIMDL